MQGINLILNNCIFQSKIWRANCSAMLKNAGWNEKTTTHSNLHNQSCTQNLTE